MSNEIENIVDLFDEFFILPEDENNTSNTSPSLLSPEPTFPAKEHVQPNVVNETPVVVPIQLPEELPVPIQYSGANKRHIVFIYNDKINDSRENVEMISNLIRNALKISFDDVAIMRLSKNPQLSIQSVMHQLTPKQVIVFGGDELLPNEQLHEVKMVNDTKWLKADWVKNYLTNQEHKAAFWAALQFALNA